MISSLLEYIKEINELHKEVSEEFIARSNCGNFNFKKVTIKTIIDLGEILPTSDFDDELINYRRIAMKYVSKLNDVGTNIKQVKGIIDTRSRLKQPESIYNKLTHYRNKAEKIQDSPLNKCLNDMVGLRIVVVDWVSRTEKFVDMLNQLKKEQCISKWMERDLDGYKAIHIYFKNGNNVFFP